MVQLNLPILKLGALVKGIFRPLTPSESLKGPGRDNAVNSEERRRASSSLPEIYAADLSDGEVPEVCIRHWTKGLFRWKMFSHGQSCLRIIQDGLDEPGIVEEQSTMLAYSHQQQHM